MQALKFDPDIFFLYLLPPIIYDTAYKMKRGAFFKNIGLTMALAWGGTLFSTFAIGTVVYVAGRSGSIFAISFVECTVFGALISATDPVSVIAVFEKKRVNRNLNAVVVGESVLNDAVSITLVRVLLGRHGVLTREAVAAERLDGGQGWSGRRRAVVPGGGANRNPSPKRREECMDNQ